MPVRLREIGSGHPDINIRFETGKHGKPGDGDREFFGRRKHDNKLAHAWGPYHSAVGISGDVHFDDDDDWTDYLTFRTVALHELGHVMGLLHSDDIEAIMYPGFHGEKDLGQDDINAMRELYGSWTRPTPAPTRRPGGRLVSYKSYPL
jgi:hypothetical protein